MSDIATKRETFRAAVELLVERAVSAGNPNNPGAYAASIRADLLNDHRSTAMELLDLDPSLTAESLAESLEPAPVAQGRQEQGAGAPNPSSAIPTYEAEPWKPVPPRQRALAKERIAAIKAQLKEQSA